MCCDPCGMSLKYAGPSAVVSECPDCGQETILEYGEHATTDACAYSPEECKTCGWAPCDLSC